MEHYFIPHRFIEPIIIKNSSNNIFWTIIAGVFVFIIGQLLLEFIIKPLREYKNIKNEVYNKLRFYSNAITSPISIDDLFVSNSYLVDTRSETEKDFSSKHNQMIYERYINISREIRKLSCDLEVKYLDNCSFIRNIFIKENLKNIDDSVSCLMRISNSLFDKKMATSNSDDIDNIKKHLNLIKR